MVALAVTFSVAVCGGLVGLVLGAVGLPPLIALIGDARDAAGTNIALSGATAIAGAFRHVRAGRIHTRAFRLLVVPGTVGGVIGGYGADYLSERLLLGVVAVVVAIPSSGPPSGHSRSGFSAVRSGSCSARCACPR